MLSSLPNLLESIEERKMKITLVSLKSKAKDIIANCRMLFMLLRHQADAAIPSNHEEMFKEPENAMVKAARRVC
ncbi:hypothetical protein HMPREF3091_20695 [Hafnia sp. HMSC23F03]|nr:hypothetical protein HMPREF3091_20695 [Hafnia sp. HMSC23F03]